MTYIRNNLSASTAGRYLAGAQNKQQKTLQKLASGYAVNSAADDAAGLSVSEKMRMYITGLDIGTRNIRDGSSLCQTADGALEEVHAMLNRLYELTEQAANGTNTDEDRELINQEIEQLKTEIGRIGGTTNFNGIKVFQPYYEFRVEGNMQDLEIFNSSYDPVTKKATYGGISFKGERFEWNAISPGMVDQNGKFVAGTYNLQTASGKLTFICKDGWEPPQIMRQFDVSADAAGIKIDGETISWGSLRDADGSPFSTGAIRPDSYSFNYHGATIHIDMFGDAQSLDDVIKQINKHASKNMVWTSTGTGSIYSEAVDIVSVGQNGSIQVQMKNSMVAQLVNDKLSLKIRADNDGVWVEDSTGAAIGTKMTWEDMGILSWNSGSDVTGSRTYTYKDTDSDYGVEFQFKLLNETSKDSIIQGLDGVDVKYGHISNNNKTELEVATPPGQILSGSMTYFDRLTLSELIALGRDFDVQTETLGSSVLKYDKDIPQWSVIFKDKNGGDLFTYVSNSQAQEDVLKNYATNYAAMVEQIAIKAALTKSPVIVDLSELVGQNNITSSGHLSEVVTATADMKFTKGTGSFKPPAVGQQYSAAHIDFSGLDNGSYSLSALNGLGFDSTCKTCSNHYSVVFVDSLAAGTGSTTPEGYGYSMERTGNDYIMKIDISTLKNATPPISTGAQFTDALITVLDKGGMDEHFTQYAAKGSVLYIMDDRASSAPAPSASFYTHPFNMPPGQCDININLDTPSPPSKKINLSYSYDLKDIKNEVKAKLLSDNNGDYVFDNASQTYVAYDPLIHQGQDRYRLDVQSLNVNDYVKKVMQDVADKSTLSLKATDFEKVGTTGFDELMNEAVETIFESVLDQTRPSLWIQASAEDEDGLLIELPALNLTVLGIRMINALTRESAAESMDKIYSAINKVSFMRGDFGAYYNRLGVMEQRNENYSSNLQAAESRIRDVDMSKEVMKNVKTGLLLQSSQAMLAQANMLPQSVLSLLK